MNGMELGRGATWTLTGDRAQRIATLRVIGSPTKEDIVDARKALTDFALAARGQPWAILSDLRAMTITTREGQEQWAANMEAYVAQGLVRWSVLTTTANSALQATVVARSASLRERTLVTTDEAEALRWAIDG